MRSCHFFLKILRDDRGATSIEYGLIVALIAISIVGAMQSLANETIGLWSLVTDNVSANM